MDPIISRFNQYQKDSSYGFIASLLKFLFSFKLKSDSSIDLPML